MTIDNRSTSCAHDALSLAMGGHVGGTYTLNYMDSIRYSGTMNVWSLAPLSTAIVKVNNGAAATPDRQSVHSLDDQSRPPRLRTVDTIVEIAALLRTNII